MIAHVWPSAKPIGVQYVCSPASQRGWWPRGSLRATCSKKARIERENSNGWIASSATPTPSGPVSKREREEARRRAGKVDEAPLHVGRVRGVARPSTPRRW
jgi:hypothetical protein